MNKTPKLKSRTLGLRSRGQRGIVVSFKEVESDSNMQTKEFKMNGRSGMITPEKTQILQNSSYEESPDLNDESPNLRSDISRAFGSPEIEVSWDYSCSQAHKESVVPAQQVKQRRRKRFPKALPPLLNLHPRLLLPDGEMSEEERKKKIDCLKGFYSELFCNEDFTSSRNSQSGSMDSTKENSSVSMKCEDNNMVQSVKVDTDQINSFFNDSSNDIILECTQAVEELFEQSHTMESNLGQMVQESDINMNNSKILPVNNRNKFSKTSLQNFDYCAKTELFSNKKCGNQKNNLKMDQCAPQKEGLKFINNEGFKTNFHLLKNSGQNQGSLKSNEAEGNSVKVENENLQRDINNKNETDNSEHGRKVLNKDIHDLFDDSIDEIMMKCSQNVEEEILSQESTNKISENKTLSKKHSASPLVKCSKVVKINYKQAVHVQNSSSGDKSNKHSTKLNSCEGKLKALTDTTVNSVKSSAHLNIPNLNGVKMPSNHTTSRQKHLVTSTGPAKQKDTDMSTLLNDDDDAFLTSIDFSTIDTAYSNEKSVGPVTHSKIYSQHEIEAKRREALEKLRRKVKLREKT